MHLYKQKKIESVSYIIFVSHIILKAKTSLSVLFIHFMFF